MPRFLAFALFVCALPVVAGCGGCSSNNKPAHRISGAGATFINPIMQKWASEYKGAEVDYLSKGSGFGIEQMTVKSKDFGCSDAPMTKEQLAAAKEKGGDVIHVPMTMGAVAVVINVPEIAGKELKLTGDVLADIYRKDASVLKWSAKRIVDLNPGLSLPDKDIVVVARAEKSGTTNIFSEYLSKASGGKIKASTMPDWPQGIVKQEANDGVAGFVKGNSYTIGYVEVLFAKKNELAVVKLKNKAGEWVSPDADGVTAAATEAMKVKQDKEPYSLHDLTFSLTDADGAKSYPISGISYGVIFAKLPKDKGPAVVEFLKWATTEGQKFAKELEYAPLPDELSKKIQEKLGTVTFE